MDDVGFAKAIGAVKRVMLENIEDPDMGGVPAACDHEDIPQAPKPPDDRFGPAPSAQTPDGDDVTEDSIARAVTAENPDRFLFNHTTGKWHQFDGAVWRVDERAFIREVIRKRARLATAGASKAVRARVQKNAFVRGCEGLMRHDLAHAGDASGFDLDPLLQGTPYGTVDLRCGKLRDPDPADRITMSTRVAPADFETCMRWHAFMEFACNGDDALARFLQQFFGCGLTGLIREHLFLYVYGDGGTGKSLLVNTLAYIMGDYALIANMQTFLKGAREKHPTGLASMEGKRLVIGLETEAGQSLDQAQIKSLVAGDPLQVRTMGKDFRQVQPAAKLVLVSNHAPAMRNIDNGMRRRMLVVPFDRRPEAPDPDLPDALKAEAPGIMRWMLNGLVDYVEHGFVIPPVVQAATDAYFSTQDTFGTWLAEECDEGPLLETTARALFESWVTFATSAGERPGSQKVFGESLSRRGFRPVRKRFDGTNARMWAGLALKSGGQHHDF